jgi:DNA helicase-2/ATP-dependent DNA helicase PcrA
LALNLIGDPKQTLYLFRNANPDLLAKMDILLPGSKNVSILKNYRSSKQLVQLANYISEIFKEDFNIVKYSDPVKGEEKDYLKIKEFENPQMESSFVSKEIVKLIHEGIILDNISILARTNNELLEFEAGLITEKIPYKIKYDSRSILNQSAFKILYSIYSIMFNSKDINALCEILLPIKGFGSKFIEQIRDRLNYLLLRDNSFSIFDFVKEEYLNKNTKQYKILYEFMEKGLKPIRKCFQNDRMNFLSFNREILDILKNTVEFDQGEEKYNSILKLTIEESYFIKAINTLSKMYSILLEEYTFKKMNDINKFFYIYQTLQLSQDTFILNKGGVKKSSILLSTIHSFKGKESDYIFGVSLKSYKLKTLNNFEDKCVFYVLVTRAKKKLYLTSSRYIRGFKGDLVRSYENEFLNLYQKNIKRLEEE